MKKVFCKHHKPFIHEKTGLLIQHGINEIRDDLMAEILIDDILGILPLVGDAIPEDEPDEDDSPSYVGVITPECPPELPSVSEVADADLKELAASLNDVAKKTEAFLLPADGDISKAVPSPFERTDKDE